VRTFFTIYSRARLRRAGPSGPGRALAIGPSITRGVREQSGGTAPSAAGGGVSPLWGGSLAPRLQRRSAPARGPLPPRRYPASDGGGPRRYAPLMTEPARAAEPSSSRRASCRRAKITLKGAPKDASPAAIAQAPPLTLIFHGKIRRLSGGRKIIDSSAPDVPDGKGAHCASRTLMDKPGAAELRRYWSCGALHSFPS
jgi:hypothetical protein